MFPALYDRIIPDYVTRISLIALNNALTKCVDLQKTLKELCIEAAFAASLAYSSGPFLDLDFAFGVFSGVSFAAVSFTRASSFSLADSMGCASLACGALVL